MIKKAKIFGKFYSPERVLSYGRHWIFIIGSRSVGKSTGIAIQLLREYIKDGSKFIYVRRTKDETLYTCRTFFDTAVELLRDFNYPIVDFKYDKRNYWIKLEGDDKWQQCGTIIALSEEYKNKSTNLSECNNIIFDEFICYDPSMYLGSHNNIGYEFDRCLSLYNTVARKKGQAHRDNVKFIFMANNSSYYNPLFIKLGIDRYLRTDTKICAPKGVDWIVEQIKEVEATADIKNSVIYRLSDKKNRDYAFENIGFDQFMNFVEKINSPMRPLINLKYNGHTMGVYLVNNTGQVYVCDKPSNLATLALSAGDQDKINYTMALKYRDSEYMTILRDNYYIGNVIFSNNKCRYDISNYFMLTP